MIYCYSGFDYLYTRMNHNLDVQQFEPLQYWKWPVDGGDFWLDHQRTGRSVNTMMAVVGEFSAKDLEVQYHISLQSKLLCRNHARRWISQTELKKHLKMKIFFSVRFSSFLLSLSHTSQSRDNHPTSLSPIYRYCILEITTQRFIISAKATFKSKNSKDTK